MRLSFKRGYTYTRKTIGEICYPDVGRPAGGNWDTGYVRVGDNLIVFMNIGVPGRIFSKRWTRTGTECCVHPPVSRYNQHTKRIITITIPQHLIILRIVVTARNQKPRADYVFFSKHDLNSIVDYITHDILISRNEAKNDRTL